MASILFEPVRINGLKLENRILRSATWEGMADDEGRVTPQLTQLMCRLAEGGVGAIVTGHIYVDPRGQASPRQLGIHTDGHVEGLSEMTEAVHRSGGRIVAQLAHAGLWADPSATGAPALAPSRMDGVGSAPQQTMDDADVQAVKEAFVRGAERAAAAGFDGIQLHSAHGYLLSQFLSPYFNRRTDRYGGTLENRTRIHREITAAARARLGAEFPILIKMNGRDCLEGGLQTAEAAEAARAMAEGGLDAIEVSGGTGLSGRKNPIRTGIREEADEAYFRDAAEAVKAKVSIPVILVGGIRSFSVAEDIVACGSADLVSMSRPLIREPDLVRRWRDGDRSRAACRSDSRCFVPARSGEGLRCVRTSGPQDSDHSGFSSR